MSEILTESYCERCGAKFTFESAAPASGPLSRAQTLARGVRNYLTSDESLDEALAEARRERERQASGIQLQAFHDTFNFCFTCRQYTCRDCWNEAAGRCRTCAPMPGVPDPLEQRELQAALSRLEAIAEPAPPAVRGLEPSAAEALPQPAAAVEAVRGTEIQVQVAIEPPIELEAPAEITPAAEAAAPAEITPGAEAAAPEAEVPTEAAAAAPVAAEVETPVEQLPDLPGPPFPRAATEAPLEPETRAPVEPAQVPPPLEEPAPAPLQRPRGPLRPPRIPLRPPQPAAPGTTPWQIVAPDETPAAPAGWPPTPRERPYEPSTASSASMARLLHRSETPHPQVSLRVTRSVWEESTRDLVTRPGSGIQACTGCGLPLSASARFCRRCGARQA